MASLGIPLFTTIIPANLPVNNEKSEKFGRTNFKKWQQKMLFYLTTLNLSKSLNEIAFTLKELESDTQTMAAINVRKYRDFLCQNYILNGIDNKLYNVFS